MSVIRCLNSVNNLTILGLIPGGSKRDSLHQNVQPFSEGHAASKWVTGFIPGGKADGARS
jgi:hypothetical protein